MHGTIVLHGTLGKNSSPYPMVESSDIIQLEEMVAESSSSPTVRRVDITNITRTNSLPSTHHSRATFPFKPDVIRQSQPLAEFRPRPIVPVLARRCVSLPVETNDNIGSDTIYEPPDWLAIGTRGRIPTFPISSNPSDSDDCWWLKELEMIAKRVASTEVQIGEDEIELVESKEVESEGDNIFTLDEIDFIEEAEVDHSISACKEDKEGSAVPIQAAIVDEGDPLYQTPIPMNTDILDQQYSTDEIRILQEKIKDLRVEIEQAQDLDPEMEKIFQKVEDAILIDKTTPVDTTTHMTESTCSTSATEDGEVAVTQSNNEPNPSAMDQLRRTTIGITGGITTAVGVALIPCPIIPGCLVAYGGLLILATEFDAAKRALDVVKDPIDKWLTHDEDETPNPAASDKYHSSIFWQELIGQTSDESNQRKNDIDDVFMTMMKSNNYSEDSSGDGSITENPENVGAGLDTTKAVKKFLRKVLMLDSDTAKVDTNESKVGDTRESDKSNNLTSQPPNNCQQPEPPTPLSPSCQSSDTVGCRMLSFDFDDDSFNGNEILTVNETPAKGNDINFQRLNRFVSDGSITLNTLGNGNETFNMFSRQNTEELDTDCLWVRFGCNSFLDERQLKFNATDDKKR